MHTRNNTCKVGNCNVVSVKVPYIVASSKQKRNDTRLATKHADIKVVVCTNPLRGAG